MATRRYEHLLFGELDAIQRDPTRPGDDRLDAAEELRLRETDRAADPHGFDLPDAPTTREQSAASRSSAAMRENVSCPPMTRAEVGRIVAAARVLIEEHAKRSPTSEHSTLGEDGALWELNFQLGVYRQKKGMARGY